MIIRFHDQNANAQANMNANLLTEKDLINKNMKKKRKRRVNELKNVYNKLYISDDDENEIVRDAITRVSTTIR